MTRTPATLLAFLLAFAAVPARAQQSAPVTTASAPLPALLQPDAAETGQQAVIADPAGTVLRGAAIGAGIGCVVIGGLAATADAETSDVRVTNALLGCGFGAFAGGVFGFTFSLLKQIMEPR